MCSFDGSLMSCATTMHQGCNKPTRLSPNERHIVLPPYQKATSTAVSTAASDESSQILLRRYVKSESPYIMYYVIIDLRLGVFVNKGWKGPC